MVQIGISQEAYEAVARTMPLGSVAVEPYFNTKGERLVWLEPSLVDRLAVLCEPGESYNQVILRLLASEPRFHT